MLKIIIFQILLLSFVLPKEKHGINCLWYNSTCVRECPPWMILKKARCNQAYWLAQRTCDNPEPGVEGASCLFSRCDCPEPMVFDTLSGHCYDIDNCPREHKSITKSNDWMW